MDNELSLIQKQQLATWSGQRDLIISELSSLKTEKEKLLEDNKSLALSHTDIETRMIEIQGRIKELKIKEDERPELISKEIASLESRKTGLESEVTNLQKMVEVLAYQKTAMEEDVQKELSVLAIVKGHGLLLEKVVDHVTRVSTDNASAFESLSEQLRKTVEELLKITTANVEATNGVIKELPVVFLEAKRQSLERQKINKKTI